MSDPLLNFPENATIFDVIYLYFGKITACLADAITTYRDDKNKNLLSIFDGLPELLYFDEFQYFLLKAFLLILIVNLVLIFVAWRVYGARICDRFMKPATNKAIEELKASVSRLKLPKEHTPRV